MFKSISTFLRGRAAKVLDGMPDHQHDERGEGAGPLAGLFHGAALVMTVLASLMCMAMLPAAA